MNILLSGRPTFGADNSRTTLDQSLSCYINFNYIKIIIKKHKNHIMNSLIRKRISLKAIISINRIALE